MALMDASPSVPARNAWQAAYHLPRRVGPRAQMALCLALAAAIRLVVLARSHGMVDSDEAVLGIQAERILRGAHPIYFYGQAYMGSWDAYLAAPLIALFGPAAWVLHTITLAESLLLVPLLGALAAQLYGMRARLPGMLLAAVPPLYVGVIQLRMLGGYVETLVLGTAILLLAAPIARRWQRGDATRALWAWVGLLVGLALWIDPLILVYAVTAAVWLAPLAVARMRRRPTEGRNWWRATGENAVVCLVAAVIGALPALVYALTFQFINVTSIFAPVGPALHLDPLRLGIASYFWSVVTPRITGAQILWGAALGKKRLLDITFEVIAGGLALAALGHTLSLLVPGSGNTRDAAWTTDPRRGRWGYALPLILVGVVFILYWRSANAEASLFSPNVDATGRYGVPLATALSLMLAVAFADLPVRIAPFIQRLRGTRWPQLAVSSHGLGSVLSGALLGMLLLAYGAPYATSGAIVAMQSPYHSAQTFPAEQAELLTYLEQQHIHYVWTTHWIGYVIMYLEDEHVQCADYVGLAVYNDFRRFPTAIEAVSHADHTSFILEVNSTHNRPALADALDTLHVTYSSAHFGQLWVITPLSRTVQPAEVLPALQADW